MSTSATEPNEESPLSTDEIHNIVGKHKHETDRMSLPHLPKVILGTNLENHFQMF